MKKVLLALTVVFGLAVCTSCGKSCVCVDESGFTPQSALDITAKAITSEDACNTMNDGDIKCSWE